MSSRQIDPILLRTSCYSSPLPLLQISFPVLSASAVTNRPVPLMETLDDPASTQSGDPSQKNVGPKPEDVLTRPLQRKQQEPKLKAKARAPEVNDDQQPVKKARQASKSRNGCITCKQKRLKCDETKPACNNCTKRNIACGGYATRYKWRVFNEGKDEQVSTDAFAGRKAEAPEPASISGALASGSLANSKMLVTRPKSASSGSTSGSASAFQKRARSKLPGGVKHEQSGAVRPLSLNDHLELAALSVVGKSSKEIEMENNLIAKGINPHLYYNRNEIDLPDKPPSDTHRMQRSYSSHDIPVEHSPTALHRSQSMSAYNIPSEVQSFRSANSSAGLQSLAEVAVDEIRIRSPASTPAQLDIPVSADLSPDVLPLAHYYGSDKTPRVTSAIPTPKPWLFNPIHGETIHSTKDMTADINFTPSLSAIINYAFTEDGQRNAEPQSSKLLIGHGVGAPSPLDLNIGNHIDLESPAGRRRSSVVSSVPKFGTPGVAQEVTSPQECSQLLYEVGCLLGRNACPSPSIVRSSSSESLLRSSEHEQILFLYSTYTSGIMSIKSGAAENPWKNLYLPVCSQYPFLFNSIASMTLFHLACNSKIEDKSDHLRAKGYAYMKSCILELASGLSKMENNVNCEHLFPADVALATCLNLAVSESWDTHISSGIAHLKGANSMIQKVLSVLKQYVAAGQKNKSSSIPKSILKQKLVFVNNDEWKKIEEFDMENKDPALQGEIYIPRNLQLLFNQWIYFEVLSQMTCYNGQDIKGIDLVATITKIIQTTEKKRDEDSKGSESVNSPMGSQDLRNSGHGAMSDQFHYLENFDAMLRNVDYVDPLLGCAQSLFLIMGRVANLISKVRISKESDKKQTRNSLTNISIASELKQQLVDWRPNITGQIAELGSKEAKDSSWDFYSCISTAEAYRYATLLYLHEAVPEVPLISSHQLAEKIFVLLASIPSNSNLFIVHIFPLLVSSCEAEPGEEREWCLMRWASLSKKLWIGNIDRAFEVVKEVWKRKDEQTQKSKDNNNSEKLDLNDPRDFSVHLQGLMSSINKNKVYDDKGIVSKTHWSTIMMEWGWEVLLA